MENRILKFVGAMAFIIASFIVACKADEEAMCLRTETGIYHDYLVVETKDGNLWELADDVESKYLENTFVNDMLVRKAIFEDGEKVRITFDTQGTESIIDDIILNVQ